MNAVPGRNDPCPCGSGKKYKHCCIGQATARTASGPDANQLVQAAFQQHQAGRLEAAEALYRQALQLAPDHPDALYLLGMLSHQAGKDEFAIDLIERAIRGKPADPYLHDNLGLLYKALNRLNEAEASYRRALEIEPDFAEAHYNLGVTLQDMRRPGDAERSYRRALRIKPEHADAHYNLGTVLQDQGRLSEAEASYRRALAIDPGYAEAHNNLGTVLRDQGRLSEAEACHRRALVIHSDYAEAQNNLGNALQDQGRLNEAEASFLRALAIDPNYAEAHYNLGNAQKNLGRLSEAEASYRRALKIKPDYAEAYLNLGTALQAAGELDAAVASFRRALAIKPDYAEAHSNLIFSLDLTEATMPALQQERDRWDAMHAAPLAALRRPHANRPDPERRLRVGYVSADFRTHSAAAVFGAMLVQFDPAHFEVYAYSNSTTEDAQTRLFEKGVSCWRKIAGRSDEAVAGLIREDGIDILVDLSGHSAGNRLLVFARKPAPIQVTAWGYATGTGLRTMDVFFADPVVVPPQEKPLYAEEVRYLPSVVGSYFPQAFPAVNPLPALSAKGLTFGSLNRMAKISQGALDAWSRVLLALPASRLVLKSGELGDASARERVLGRFSRAGIDPGRIVLLGKTPWQEHMAAFNRIDIGLDPFPHGGGVTALEGLMMGVPVVALRWPSLVGRLSASILTTLGLTDWIAETPEQYVEIALQKAQALPALAELRAQLRGIFTSSIIGDAQAYVRAVEQEYRQLWRQWCTRRETVK